MPAHTGRRVRLRESWPARRRRSHPGRSCPGRFEPAPARRPRRHSIARPDAGPSSHPPVLSVAGPCVPVQAEHRRRGRPGRGRSDFPTRSPRCPSHAQRRKPRPCSTRRRCLVVGVPLSALSRPAPHPDRRPAASRTVLRLRPSVWRKRRSVRQPTGDRPAGSRAPRQVPPAESTTAPHERRRPPRGALRGSVSGSASRTEYGRGCGLRRRTGRRVC